MSFVCLSMLHNDVDYLNEELVQSLIFDNIDYNRLFTKVKILIIEALIIYAAIF